MFDQFQGNSCLPKSFLSYFVTLIPKVNSPFSISDFRPISLLGCLYKLITKVLAKRLAKVIDSVIAPNQSTFIKGRNLVDGVLVVNEMVELAKKSKRECLIFKVDFEKAYNLVDWGFLEYMLQRCGFCEKWIGWIRVCVFAENLSVRVNGSTTSGINIQRGLKQGDPLAPFLFLLVVEDFSGVMRKAVELNAFKGFSIERDSMVISHLQYADDTLCIGEASIENLWTLKAILRGFEMASGVKVNFWKSGLSGVNVHPTFLETACNFLNCRRGTISFKYLGLPIGANSKSLTTWGPLVQHLRKRLFSWRNKHISLGGRIVLINVVLNAIPIFYLSFMKMPVIVWKWCGFKGSSYGGNKVSWVKWAVVCKAKSKGGLGVRDARIVNLSLLTKRRWRLLLPGRALWKDVLVAKYGSLILTNLDWSGFRIPTMASKWWKDIFSLDKVVESKNWALFLWEEDLVERLKDLLVTVTLRKEDDGWKWVPDPEGVFSVKSIYLHLVEELRSGESLDDGRAMIFDQIWESPAPSKVIAFSWQLLHDRIPTRSNLDVRGILLTDWECVGCVGSAESSIHLFLHCPSSMMVWYEIFRCLGLVIVIPSSLFSLFEVMRASARNVNVRKGYLMIWHATLWSLWKARNGSIFANRSFVPKEIVEELKL
ncbi:LINE-1 reverse transcriptase like [Trifolium medium]|uniref:LINE-1 reverse transcriptase like n=1 Tax=Trifolium medium TaxID=97028 RepID=A0A392LZL4_9FABA|nr:LINE-1 reverse transcriptase like [Trifolium medium]